MSKFEPRDNLEFFVISKDNQKIIESIISGARLTRVDIFAQEEYYDLTLGTALILAFIGLPKELRQEAIDLEKKTFDEGSEYHDFLEIEFKNFEHPKEPNKKEKKILDALKKGKMAVISEIDDNPDLIENKFPNEYIPYLNKLPDCILEDFFDCLMDYRPMAMLIEKLLSNDDQSLPKEVKALSSEVKKKLIDQLSKALLDGEDEEDFGKEDPYSVTKAIEFARNLLKKLGFSFIEEKEKNGLAVGLSFKGKYPKIATEIYAHYDFVVMNAIAPFECPMDKLKEAAEYIVLANHCLTGGHFNLNMENGDIFLNQYCTCQSFMTDPEYLQSALFSFPPEVFQLYLPGLEKVIKGKMTPKEAFLDATKQFRQ